MLRKLILAVYLCCLPLLTGAQAAAEEEQDPLDAILAKRPIAERLEYVERLIRENPHHPRMIDLEFYRTRKLPEAADPPEKSRELIKEIERICEKCPPDDPRVFEAMLRIGGLYHDYLHDKRAAYEHYEKMLQKGFFPGKNSLEQDYNRLYVHLRLAEAACPLKDKRKEAEENLQLVMAYPHLGMEDRKMYRRFYELYDIAGLYLISFWSNKEDLPKLMALEIYPSHPGLIKMRREIFQQRLVGKPLDKVREEMVEHLTAEALMPEKGEEKATARGVSSSESTPAQSAGEPQGSSLPEAQLAVTSAKKVLIGIICVVGVLLAVSLIIKYLPSAKKR